MKWNSIGRAALATGMTLAIGLGATSCSRDYVVAYVYGVSATNSTVSAFAVDYQSGALTQLTGSPFQGLGKNPVAIIASPSGKSLYVLNHDDSSITVFSVGTDGKIYGQETVSIANNSATDPVDGAATFPTFGAIDAAGKFLYVTYTYQNGGSLTPTSPPYKGGVAIFPINSDGSLGSPTGVPVGVAPVGLAISNPTTAPAAGNVFVYVLDQESALNDTSTPQVLGFQQNTSTGALTLLSGSSCTTNLAVPCIGTTAGITPSAIVIEPTSRFVYVTDKVANELYSYSIANSTVTAGNNGNLTALVSSPNATGSYPVGATVDPRGKYVYVANYNANTVGGYTINAANGALGSVATGGAAQVATGPTCVTIEPALGKYLYTSNQLDGSISGEEVDANTGQLSRIVNSPYTAAPLLSCLVAVASGSHAQSVDNP